VSHFTVSAAVAAVQLVVILFVFSVSPTRQPRYLLPALPYIAFLVAWALQQVGHAAVTGVAAVVFSCQLMVSHAQALGIFPAGATVIRPLIRSESSTAILQGIVDRTCRDVGQPGYFNVIAIHPSLPEMGGDWLAPDPLNYIVEKARCRPDSVIPCLYGYLGDDFFGAPLDQAWESLVSRQARYIIIVDPAVHPIPVVVFNQGLTREMFPLVMDKVRTSGLFLEQPDLLQDPGILIFRRRMPGATRALFSRLTGRQLGDVNGRIELREEGILIHPGDSTPTLATFRLDGEIREMVVRLSIAPLDTQGKTTPEAGNVNVALLLDDKPLFEAYIDRTSVIERTLSVSGRNLTVRVDNANGKSWWDWFLLTFLSMQ